MTSKTSFATGYSGNYSIPATAEYQNLGGDPARSPVAGIANFQYIPPVGCDIGLIGLKLNATTGTNREIWLDDNGSNVLDYIAPAGTNGVQRDTSYYTALAGAKLTFGAKAGSGSFSANGFLGVLKSSTTPISVYCAADVGFNYAVSNSSRRLPVYGAIGLAAAASNTIQVVMKTTGTFLRGQINISSNARTVSTTFTLLKNGSATGMVITVGAGLTGQFYNDTAVSYTDGDRIDWQIASGVDANIITITTLYLTAQTTSGKSSDLFGRPGTTVTGAGSATPSYISVTGRIAFNATESTKEFAFGFPVRLSNFRAFLTAAAGYDAVLTVRKNGVDTSLAISIPTGASGDASDLVNTVDLAASDTVTIKRTGGTTGSIVLSYVGFTVEDLTDKNFIQQVTIF